MLLGQYFLIMRSSMVDVLTEDFITVKRATGLPRERVVSSHAVPNALLPLVTLSAIQFGAVVGGAITIETIFSWPGLGELSYQAIQRQGLPRPGGHVPRLQRRRDRRQPARRLPLLRPRPAGAVAMTEHERAHAWLLGNWRGRLGVGVLAVALFVAIFGTAARARRPERLQHRRPRGSRAGAICSARPRTAPTSSRSCSSARGSRSSSASPRRSSPRCWARSSALRRLFRRLDRSRPRRAGELVPGDPDAAADDRPGAAAESVADRPDRRHRLHLLGRDRADRARPGADAARARLRRAGAGARRQGRATSSRPTSCPTRCR